MKEQLAQEQIRWKLRQERLEMAPSIELHMNDLAKAHHADQMRYFDFRGGKNTSALAGISAASADLWREGQFVGAGDDDDDESCTSDEFDAAIARIVTDVGLSRSEIEGVGSIFDLKYSTDVLAEIERALTEIGALSDESINVDWVLRGLAHCVDRGFIALDAVTGAIARQEV